MKNYFFNPNDYGSHWTVLANSPEEALRLVKEHMITSRYWLRKDWADATIDNLPDDYTIDEYKSGEVIDGSYS